MSRWRVMKNHFADAWAVYHEPPKSAGIVPWYRVPQWFDTWAEAMAYADQQARTIQVTLPRITGDMEDGMSSWPNLRGVGLSVDHHDEPRLGQPYVMIYDGYSDIGVEAYDLKPLALALLALGFKETQ